MTELKEMVKSIAKDINQGVSVEADELDYYDYPYSEGDLITGFDYLQDALDIQWVIDSKGEYIGARVLVAFGGPNIWINTLDKVVEGYWGGEEAYARYYDDPMEINETLREIYETTR